MINEVFILIAFYFMYMFTNYVPDDATVRGLNFKTLLGRFMLALMLMFVLINIFMIARAAWLSFKDKKRSKLVAKLMRKRERLTKKLEKRQLRNNPQ